MTTSADRLIELKDLFIAKRGYWNENWQFILEHDPEFFEAYLHLSSYAWDTGTLDPKTKEFLYIVTVAAVSHIFPPGLHQHMHNAIGLGASEEELLAVLQIASTMGVQTFLLGAAGIDAASPGAGHAHGLAVDPADVRRRHEDLFGTPSAAVETAIATDAAFYQRWLDLAAVPFAKSDVLEPKTAHLLAFTAYASVTQQSSEGARMHAQAALDAGATAAELLEALELTTGMSIHSVTIGLPILFEELKRAESEQ